MQQIKGNFGAEFTATNTQSAHLVSAMINHNVLTTLNRQIMHVFDDSFDEQFGPDVGRGDRLVLFLFTTGALNEALGIYRKLHGVYKQAQSYHSQDDEVQKSIETLNDETDDANSDSLYNRIIRTVRNKGAFHWRDECLIKSAIDSIDDKEHIVATNYSKNSERETSRFVIGDELHLNIAFGGSTPSKEELRPLIQRIVSLNHAFCVATEALFRARFDKAGWKLPENDG